MPRLVRGPIGPGRRRLATHGARLAIRRYLGIECKLAGIDSSLSRVKSPGACSTPSHPLGHPPCRFGPRPGSDCYSSPGNVRSPTTTASILASAYSPFISGLCVWIEWLRPPVGAHWSANLVETVLV